MSSIADADRTRRRYLAARLLLAPVLLVVACSGRSSPEPAALALPVFPGSSIVERIESDDRDPTDTYVVESVSPSEVLAWYRREMPGRGWHATGQETEDVAFYRDENGCFAFVMASPQADGGVFLQLSRQRTGLDCARTTPGPADGP